MRHGFVAFGVVFALSAGIQAQSNTTSLKAQFFPEYNSSRVQISYGPFTAPSSTDNNGMQDFVVRNVAKPCSSCLITFIEAGLQYPNGTYANSNTGMWLHHTVLFNENQTDTVCPTNPSRFFASGNERTPINICVNGTQKAGYFLNETDQIAILVELMNETVEPRDAVVTITFEYIPTVPSGFNLAAPVWLDIGNCTNSDMPAQANTTFEYSSAPWTSDITGQILDTAGHIHDGGTYIEVLQNNKMICNCSAAYGQTPGYIETTPMNMSMMNMNMGMDMVHISSITSCFNDGTLKKGDTLGVTAHYNTSEYAPMMDNDGSLSPIMGISLLYVAIGGNSSTTPSASSTTSGSPSSTTVGASHTATNAASRLSGAEITGLGAVLGLWILFGV
ncbi:hypothetical protein AOQ84DRAFT_439525 [Glonium stellatum]|uniref:Uncharacterized protein n=1 Tax=Glonium stellatum TaxID=574774 RepID=A0A8E2F240_9PEZI|nr:hypothetical protein AOQ84DRAFT_439525 [Glonium stellatum]